MYIRLQEEAVPDSKIADVPREPERRGGKRECAVVGGQNGTRQDQGTDDLEKLNGSCAPGINQDAARRARRELT
jgi:hypothetical protein